MAKKNETILNLLAQAPWWVSVILSITAYVVFKFIVPAINFQSWVLKGIAGAAPQIALILALVLLIPAPISFFNSLQKRKLLDKQKDLDSIKSLSWKEFEELVAEAYRRKGYSVVENYGIGPDGGV
jgi:restriction system protein